MAYPGPPGLSKNTALPSSLPPRPPVSKVSGFKPAFPAAPSSYPSQPPLGFAPTSSTTATSYSSAPTTYGAAAPTPVSYGAPPGAASYAAPTSVGRAPLAPATYGSTPSYSYAQTGYQQQPGFYGANGTAYSAPPQIQNPFPAPNAQSSTDYDPETAIQIAQWQSAYMPKDASEQPARAAGGRPGTTAGGYQGAQTSAGHNDSSVAASTASGTTAAAGSVQNPNEKKKTVYREGGGKKWQDESLLEWDPSHLRLFVGNLAGETTDESLLKAFASWRSVQRAKVVRDKRTTKSKGYGFVSFSDPDDFFQAAKEMNGKYIQSHPVVVHKAKTEIKPHSVKEDRRNQHKRGAKGGKNGKNGKNGNGGSGGDGAATGYEPQLGPVGAGVTKPGQKTRGGLKLLG